MESKQVVVEVPRYRPTWGGGCAFFIIFFLALSLGIHFLVWWWLCLWLLLLPIGFYEYRTYYYLEPPSSKSISDNDEEQSVKLIL